MKYHWLFFVLHRFNAQSKAKGNFIANLFPVLGIGFGVTVLIVVLAVMNGFQRGYIDTVIEVSSAHVRLEAKKEKLEELRKNSVYKSFVIFDEEEALLQGRSSTQATCMIRAVEKDIYTKDDGFKEKVKIIKGSFNLEEDSQNEDIKIVLGNELSRRLGVKVGSVISVIATSGSSESDLFPYDVNLSVVGLFKTGYYEIDSSFAFINLDASPSLFGKTETHLANVKLERDDQDIAYISNINDTEVKVQSWRDYNRAFFGALKIEKNVMMLLIILIFLVVSVNIYNGMRRSIYERREDISVLLAMGAKESDIKTMFIFNSFVIGMLGSLFGLILGLFVSIHINDVFSIIEKGVNVCIYFVYVFTNGSMDEDFAIFNRAYFYMEKVPVKMFFSEIFCVFMFGLISSSVAAWIATKKVMEINLAETLRYE